MFQEFEATMMTHEDIDEIYKMALHIFRPWACIGATLPTFGPSPYNFEVTIDSFMNLCQLMKPTQGGFQHPRMAAELLLHPTISTPARPSFRLGFCLFKSSPWPQLHLLRLCPATRARLLTEPLLSSVLHLYPQYPDCKSQILFLLRFHAGIRPS